MRKRGNHWVRPFPHVVFWAKNAQNENALLKLASRLGVTPVRGVVPYEPVVWTFGCFRSDAQRQTCVFYQRFVQKLLKTPA